MEGLLHLSYLYRMVRRCQGRTEQGVYEGTYFAADHVASAIVKMRCHKGTGTGITESREMRTSSQPAKAASALISFSVTARARGRTASTSTTAHRASPSLGSGYGSET